METKVCKECGRELPATMFKLTRWGTRTEVCNECVTSKIRETKANKRIQIGGGLTPFPMPTLTAKTRVRS